MGFFSKLFDSNSEMIEWQNLVMNVNYDKLKFSRSQLETATIQLVQDSMRIFDDSANIINSTVDPDTFFSRLNLAQDKMVLLTRVEPFMEKIKAITLSTPIGELSNEFFRNKQQYIASFLRRSVEKTEQKSATMKTDKGKMNQYIKLKENLEPYRELLSSENQTYLDSIFENNIK
ncbi:hypothetical protein ACPW7J_01985 [Ihubacter sp. rT4E-8]|uniref:hypothetical protein n=1 Tax=Ihubacter sp. rT4E-8 TaxID=3242369 RepID=UPI003CE94B15